MISALLISALVLPQAQPEDSAIKVFSTIREPDFDRPWAKRKPVESFGSAVLLSSGLIVTNAHVVDYAQRVELLPNGATERYEAEVLHLSYEDDLALVRPLDDSFFDEFPSIELTTTLPAPGSEVVVAGFPEGGDELSKTTGNVNRYVYRRAGGFQGLALQVDASINEGNSGGPVFQDGKVIGIAFQKNKSARTDNIGYVIPGETVQRFLDDAQDGEVEGTRSLRVSWSRCENPVMRKHLGMSKDQDGVILYPSSHWTPEHFAIQPLDVLLEIAGHSVDNYGRIELSDVGMVEWEYMVPWAGASGVLPLTILRNKEVLQLEVETILEVPSRIVRLEGRYPSYYIYGPVTFVELSAEHLARFNGNIMFQNQISGWPGILESGQPPTPEYQRVVSANFNLLSHRIAKGYESPLALPVLRKINGVSIKDLEHLASILENMESETVFFEFDSRGRHSVRNFDREGKQDFVFDHKEVLRTREEILEEAGIRRYYSKDLSDLIQD